MPKHIIVRGLTGKIIVDVNEILTVYEVSVRGEERTVIKFKNGEEVYCLYKPEALYTDIVENF